MTEEEESAVRSLKRLANKWPRTLGLFSNSGTLIVIKLDSEGVWPEPGGLGYEDRTVLNLGRRVPNDGGCLPYDGN